MKFRYELVAGFGAFVLGISANAVSGQSASRHCSSDECACEEALNKSTVEALENFLRKYPHAAQGESACAAIAVPRADGGVIPEDQSHDQNDTLEKPIATPAKG
jgi:hypothetical protein